MQSVKALSPFRAGFDSFPAACAGTRGVRAAAPESSGSSLMKYLQQGSQATQRLQQRAAFWCENYRRGRQEKTYVVPSGAGATAFEQQWLCGGAAAEAALQKVTLLTSLKF